MSEGHSKFNNTSGKQNLMTTNEHITDTSIPSTCNPSYGLRLAAAGLLLAVSVVVATVLIFGPDAEPALWWRTGLGWCILFGVLAARLRSGVDLSTSSSCDQIRIPKTDSTQPECNSGN
jgi:hypothetical protein